MSYTRRVARPRVRCAPRRRTRGGQIPLAETPGLLRPLSAALGIVPIECGKHDTTATRWYEDDPTQKSNDGKVVSDTVKILRTDT